MTAERKSLRLRNGRAGIGAQTARAGDRKSGCLLYTSSGYFAQKLNLFRSRHYELLLEILRFNRQAPKLLLATEPPQMTLGEYLDESLSLIHI